MSGGTPSTQLLPGTRSPDWSPRLARTCRTSASATRSASGAWSTPAGPARAARKGSRTTAPRLSSPTTPATGTAPSPTAATPTWSS
uniref:Uncharacterized protein n=1 Tax=Arundo donax TaxID=35708 RepID=A0A0A9E445_ARUDO